jgi:NADPH:quinone reductase-like Zn-dependent oxidoreductase
MIPEVLWQEPKKMERGGTVYLLCGEQRLANRAQCRWANCDYGTCRRRKKLPFEGNSETMKAVIYDKKGTPDKLILHEVPTPEPNENEVLIQVHSVSANAADYRSMKMGTVPKHKIFGSGIAGRVAKIGKAVTLVKPGDAVLADLADSGFGGFAEYVVVAEKLLVLKPATVSFEEAATLPVAATTALAALRNKVNIRKGQKVLILGSSGGVGTFAVQLAHHFGAEVTAVCSSGNLEQSRSLGADHVIDYTQEDITKTESRYDFIIAINGNYPLLACKRLLSSNGIYVMVGGSFAQIFKAILGGWLLSFGSKKIRFLAAKSNQPDLAFVTKLLAEGKIKAVMESTYPFEKTADAIGYLSKGHAKGKVVINVSP